MITINVWKYGCPKGHVSITHRRHGVHAGMIFCRTCNDWYFEQILRK
jgi:hypothetical protein